MPQAAEQRMDVFEALAAHHQAPDHHRGRDLTAAGEVARMDGENWPEVMAA